MLRLEHAAIANLATGLFAMAHAHHLCTILGDLCQIALGRGVRPHLAIHGRRHQQRLAGRTCQTGQADQFVRPSLRQPCDEVGAARRQHDHIGLAAHADVRHVVGAACIPLAQDHGSARKCLHGDRRDELAGSLGHHHLHRGTALDQQPAQLGRLVAGHAASQSQ